MWHALFRSGWKLAGNKCSVCTLSQFGKVQWWLPFWWSTAGFLYKMIYGSKQTRMTELTIAGPKEKLEIGWNYYFSWSAWWSYFKESGHGNYQNTVSIGYFSDHTTFFVEWITLMKMFALCSKGCASPSIYTPHLNFTINL